MLQFWIFSVFGLSVNNFFKLIGSAFSVQSSRLARLALPKATRVQRLRPKDDAKFIDHPNIDS